MIITKTPFRISLAGGGSDFAEYYREQEGAVLSTSINKHIYLSLHPYFHPDQIHLKYSTNELVKSPAEIRHPIFRELLTRMKISGVEITSIADIPSGTGLGSSSAFTVGLHQLLNAYQDRFVSKADLARMACETEITHLGEPIGKQDQYASAFGGLNLIRFLPSGDVIVEPLMLSSERRKNLEKNLLMFYTHDTRSTRSILAEQKGNLVSDRARVDSLRKMVKYVHQMKTALESGNPDEVGGILNESWKLKKTLASGVSTERIDHYYRLGMENGALGGKLLGAGGGGFLLFYVKPENHEMIRKALPELREISFEFELRGAEVIYYDNQRF